ncbi:hypothetical protein P691DRAFT_812150 [Macrolepiota fuliginosa MF-IS2]|uniref:SH3 domain-containing protein n=1 Tax=Macrolepiota fuliginosa MF-IS2 TaxID=1400762 RepID=A0A9P5XF60_9AGAR|nr:hypothetical protein P691DRAFT_812150 [Macrolepiota fuliginosa MF-IS2]
MHSKYMKKGLHRRERARVVRDGVEERQITAPVTLTVVFTRSGNNGDSDGPTITPLDPEEETTVLLPPPLTTSAPPLSSQPAPLTTSTLAPVAVSTLLTSSTTPSSLTTSEPAPTSLSPTISPASSTTVPTPVPNMPDTGQSSSTGDDPKLSSGAIAGIVIGCLVVLLVAAILGLRKRTVHNRLKLRGLWTGSKGLGFGNPLEPRSYAYNQSSTINGRGLGESSMGFIGEPASAGTPRRPTSISILGSGLPQALPSAYGSEGSVTPSQAGGVYMAVVALSFVPRLPDELSISTGETLRVLEEYDDGWAKCMSLSGETGMVPLECFDRQRNEEMQRNSRRHTSLPSARR